MIFTDIYTVKSGDTVSGIANLFNVSPKSIIANNMITTPENLVVGQALLILKPEIVHTVKQGESLYKIASDYSISVIDLLRNNYFLMGSVDIRAGETLVIKYEGKEYTPAVVNSYAYPYINPYVLNSSLIYQTYLSPFTYGFTPEGALIEPDDSYMLSRAKFYGVESLLHLSTYTGSGFSSEIASILLNSPSLQDTLIANMKRVMNEKGFSGADIDFEFVYANEAELYAEFIKRAREELNPYGYKVIVALAPKTYDEQPGDIYQGHNYALLGEAANLAFVMTYEWGYSYSPPMAVAPIKSVERVIEYALSRIPAGKILMGIPNYGYDWTLPYVKGQTRARVIGNLEAIEIAKANSAEIEFDEETQTPHFDYTANSISHSVWFEDARSIKAKLDIIKKYSLAGAGYWNLMRPFPQNWLLLNNLFEII